jgi:hypothetical protein
MIIRKKKIVFVHIPKTGGSSIDSVLQSAFQAKIGKRIQTCQEIHTIIGEDDYVRFFKFVVVRNPWERFLSKFLWSQQHTGSVKKNATFRWYVDHIPRIRKREMRARYDAFSSQSDWLRDPSGKIRMDQTLRFESLSNDWHITCAMIGLDPTDLPHEKATRHGHYSDYYDDESRKVIGEMYAEDVERFGYSFGA